MCPLYSHNLLWLYLFNKQYFLIAFLDIIIQAMINIFSILICVWLEWQIKSILSCCFVWLQYVVYCKLWLYILAIFPIIQQLGGQNQGFGVEHILRKKEKKILFCYNLLICFCAQQSQFPLALWQRNMNYPSSSFCVSWALTGSLIDNNYQLGLLCMLYAHLPDIEVYRIIEIFSNR